ncbi:MAG: translation initiation factor [Muribaculaceae bacterium]|nr:translation initiation factor [Muribaculaceae bacterium]
MDWKDMLSQMRDTLPEGESESAPGSADAGQPAERKKDKLNVAMERKGRGGKTATIIYGFTGDDEEVAEVAARLKQRLGVGGSARGGEILLQGDVREKARHMLKEMGYK